jgi:flagellar transcriptional activator FlhC
MRDPRPMLPSSKARHWHALQLAKQAVEFGARLSIVTAFTGISKPELERLFCDTERPRTSTGRHPWSPYWFLTNSIVIEIQAAVFYGCFRRIRQLGHPASDALIAAYRNYLRLFSHDPRLSFDRAFELITHIEGIWTEIKPSLMTVACSDCKSAYIMSRREDAVGSGQCPFCKVGSIGNGRMLKILSGPTKHPLAP